jgi:hypothetical protein
MRIIDVLVLVKQEDGLVEAMDPGSTAGVLV